MAVLCASSVPWRRLLLLHNAVPAAACHVTMEGGAWNCGHVVEVIQAVAGDTLSVVCESAVVSDVCSNFSIAFLGA